MEKVTELAEKFNMAFPQYPPLMATDRWLYGVWMLGNDYRNKTTYYGTYPPQYIKRIKSMFTGISADDILHLFSGAVQEEGVKIDINPELNPDVVGNAEQLSDYFPENRFELVLADPPYSHADAEKYGTKLPNKRKVLHECAKVIKPNGILVWLDTILPQYTKKEFKLIGTIAIIRSTNHRVRLVSIFQREINIRPLEDFDPNQQPSTIVSPIKKKSKDPETPPPIASEEDVSLIGMAKESDAEVKERSCGNCSEYSKGCNEDINPSRVWDCLDNNSKDWKNSALNIAYELNNMTADNMDISHKDIQDKVGDLIRVLEE